MPEGGRLSKIERERGGRGGSRDRASEIWTYIWTYCFPYVVQFIQLEPDVIPAGPVALSSQKLKVSLCAETKAWRVCYGKTMKQKYQGGKLQHCFLILIQKPLSLHSSPSPAVVMEEVFSSIDEWSKQLSHTIKDLDDIRAVMATLKDIRENEIRVDMALGPIEVYSLKLAPFLVLITTPSSPLTLLLSPFFLYSLPAGMLQPITASPDFCDAGGAGSCGHTALHVAKADQAGGRGPEYSTPYTGRV